MTDDELELFIAGLNLILYAAPMTGRTISPLSLETDSGKYVSVKVAGEVPDVILSAVCQIRGWNHQSNEFMFYYGQ